MLLGLVYAFLFLGYVIAALFIVFHLTRYSLDRKLASAMTLLFITVTTVLLWSNAVIFFNLPLDIFEVSRNF